jgi:hypothetical protein
MERAQSRYPAPIVFSAGSDLGTRLAFLLPRIAKQKHEKFVPRNWSLSAVEPPAFRSRPRRHYPPLRVARNCSVGVTIVVPSADNIRSISLQYTGEESALASVEIVDGAGKSISTGISSWSLNGGPVQKSLSLSKALDDSMKLVVKVISDRKFTNVTFDVKDIPLP